MSSSADVGGLAGAAVGAAQSSSASVAVAGSVAGQRHLHHLHHQQHLQQFQQQHQQQQHQQFQRYLQQDNRDCKSSWRPLNSAPEMHLVCLSLVCSIGLHFKLSARLPFVHLAPLTLPAPRLWPLTARAGSPAAPSNSDNIHPVVCLAGIN